MYAKLRLHPHIRSFSRCSFRQTAILTGLNDRIEPIYFLYRNADFSAEKENVIFESPGCVWLLWASPEWKNKEKTANGEYVWIEEANEMEVDLQDATSNSSFSVWTLEDVQTTRFKKRKKKRKATSKSVMSALC